MPYQKNSDLLARARALSATKSDPPGLGDRVAGFLKRPLVAKAVKQLTGIDTHKPCGGCRRRQAWLNKIGA